MTSNASSPENENLLKKTFSEFSKDRCTQLAAALAYYTIFSLPPLLVLIITICGFLWSADQASNTIMTEIEAMVGERGAEQIETMLNNVSTSGQGTLATLISIAILIITATAAVAQLQMSLNQIWHIEPHPSKNSFKATIGKRIFSFAMILGVAFILLVSTILTALITAFSSKVSEMIGMQSNTIIYVATLGVELLIFTCLFAAIFKFMPDAKIRWKDVWVGSLVTSLLFTLGKFAMGLYLGSKDPTTTYGAAGNLILILLWVYYSSLILFLGAEFTQVWANKYGKRIVPDDGYLYKEVHLIDHEGQKIG